MMATTSTAARLSSVQDYQKLLDSYDTWLFDCDGVIWQGTRIVEGVLEVLQFLRQQSMCPSLDLPITRSII